MLVNLNPYQGQEGLWAEKGPVWHRGDQSRILRRHLFRFCQLACFKLCALKISNGFNVDVLGHPSTFWQLTTLWQWEFGVFSCQRDGELLGGCQEEKLLRQWKLLWKALSHNKNTKIQNIALKCEGNCLNLFGKYFVNIAIVMQNLKWKVLRWTGQRQRLSWRTVCRQQRFTSKSTDPSCFFIFFPMDWTNRNIIL